ncbi:hypothetical protein [Bythopirellula polymerisocia]|uniref:3-keto-disaccharide hydrolase domain-containing protein n=1 Tax=Bythopirellula polymerisocia TaxID=2528003 RepID=A0A5C6D0B3_9BACT|nr:hypothetical protein [Bythopirellula polymerisocia]TWU28339.1 hypothetical protein Pla144_16270 [Bythopirellula polymerisocia]
MKNSMLRTVKSVLQLGCWIVVLGNVLPAFGDDSDVIQIEEHWQLHVGGPDLGRTAPQVTMIMSPTNTLNGAFFAFTLNHWSYPEFEPGGYQLQLWQGENCVDVKHGAHSNSFANDGETITWVQRITLNEGSLKFQVVDGQSESWGSFGNEGFCLDISSQLTRLNSYLPAISLGQSGIGYAGNRVSSLTLTRLRWVTKDGVEHEMVAPIDIDTDLD